ncbi:MAG: pilus assembly protein TadG-related protein [Microlunatus sp.]|nr:pilus assembly protein TadG-related protein [Microlunatus sp.]
MITPPRDERGQSVSVFVTVVFAALIMTAGLVIDGGQKVAAASRAQTAAAGAARAAADAGVTHTLAGESPAVASLRAASAYLGGQPDVAGSASVSDGVVTVRTHATERTLFLSLVGIDSVSASATVRANAVGPGETR